MLPLFRVMIPSESVAISDDSQHMPGQSGVSEPLVLEDAQHGNQIVALPADVLGPEKRPTDSVSIAGAFVVRSRGLLPGTSFQPKSHYGSSSQPRGRGAEGPSLLRTCFFSPKNLNSTCTLQ